MSKELSLKVEDLSMYFGGIKAVDHLSFSIKENEIYGLIGPNGAGKTTVFNCITGFYRPQSGKIYFKDHEQNWIDLTKKKTHKIISYGLVRTFQNLELIQELSVIDNLLVGAHINFKTGIIAGALQTKKARREERVNREKAMDVLHFLGLEEKAHESTSGQPYGILKKIELGRTLMSQPRMIILDEPAAGLNEEETRSLGQLIRRIQKEYECTILLVEHDMRLVMDICHRICAISFGKKLGEGTPKEIQMNKNVQEAYLGKEDESA